MAMQEHTVQCISPGGLHRMYYTEWGARDNPRVVVCVHGLTRNCRDFDTLAGALAPDFRVVCPDIAGRGRSDWLTDKTRYEIPQYLSDVTALLARISADEPRDILWVGTSMGGLIGMLHASLPGSPIVRMVLNDVGPLVPKGALERIGRYVGLAPGFPSFNEIVDYVRLVSAPFGPLTDAQWEHLTRYNTRQDADGQWRMNYDPGIGVPFRQNAINDIVLWDYYDRITCPTLLLRGADSDLLDRPTALAMTQRGPHARLTEFAGVGHAPMLMSADQVAVVQEFLLAYKNQGSQGAPA